MGAATLLCFWLAAFMQAFSGAHGGYVGIVNGTIAKPHSRPYMVSVQKNMQHWCGGFLVSESFVMTAAHCVTWGQNLTVLVGAHDITNSGKMIPVKYYHINPGYNPPVQNDIALLQLEGQAQKSETVNWISLSETDKDIKTDLNCNVAGWGAIKTRGRPNSLLLQADVVLMKTETCKNEWNVHFNTAKMLCAGGKAGFCQGDSGGPLVCKNKAVGVVSFNEKNNCDKPRKPNVYTKISPYLPWIKKILQSVKH